MTKPSTLAVIVLALGLCLNGIEIWLSLTQGLPADFHVLHGSATAFLTGEDIYLSGPRTLNGHANLNPPHVIALMAPLGAMSDQNAAIAMWILIALAAGFFALAAFRVFPLGTAVAVLAFSVASPASTVAVSLINLGWFVSAVAAWAWIWARERSTVKAAIAIGCLATVKVFFLIFFPLWAWRRDWRSLAWGGGAAVSIVALGLLLLGVAPYRTWIAMFPMESPLDAVRGPLDASLYSIATRLPLRPIVQSAAWLGGAAVVLALAWGTLRRDRSVDREWAIALTAMLIVSPLGWVYYWLVPALPMAMVFRATRWPAAAIAAALIPPVLVAYAAASGPSLLAPLVASTYAITALVLYGALRA